ncbi:MAG: hypothetical protein Rpha_1812 [Candidatus Ruthia sp. Apha_13_S6]|nr:hypothetical protein [Candidatus Ruthia sp. Apha_13_S6]
MDFLLGKTNALFDAITSNQAHLDASISREKYPCTNTVYQQ